LINNVETLANVPLLIRSGARAFAGLGTRLAKGTKTFALTGKVNNVGLVEVPLGITLREIVYEIGGGISGGRSLKAVQAGGPSGGCIPAALVDTPVDFKAFQEIGAIIGSGGLVVLDERTCMVRLARYFMEFCVQESCGKCPPCRIGNKVMLNILDRICSGEGRETDLERLRDLAGHIRRTSLCGLGQMAPNPTLSTLRHFGDEYLAHIRDKTCPAGECHALTAFAIDAERCDGCAECAEWCPAGAITGEPGQVHTIDGLTCTRCGACLSWCPTDAIVTQPGGGRDV
jgi:NADH:ubiquinone oxidoreductase subunit F (NADH-binding)/NAD-dependent dihydropyrimidine dehydrogenase PreA subunit